MNFFADVGRRLPAWARGTGVEAEIVLATRARLRRNIRGQPFAPNASPRDRRRLATDLTRLVADRRGFAGAWTVTLSAVTETELRCLREQHLIGPGAPVDEGRILIVTKNMEISVQVMLEDHLHLDAWRSGLEPEAAVGDVLGLDTELEPDIDPAFSEDLGYLTARPGHVGTGLTLTALLHLPGLVHTGEIEKVLNALGQLQFRVGGLYGGGGRVRGALFVVANLVTLGRDEEEIASDFAGHVAKVVTYERLARRQLAARDATELADLAWRSLAVLRHARLVTAQEAWDRLSNLRWGVDEGVLPPLPVAALNRATIGARTGHLELRAGRTLAPAERGAARASWLRDVLAPAPPA